MDASGGSDDQKRLVVLSGEAALDLAEIHTSTTRRWGWNQAERYVEFLKSEAQQAADGLSRGRPVLDRAGKYLVVARWMNAQYSHYIIYETTSQGIYVLRILHSAMDLPRHISPE